MRFEPIVLRITRLPFLVIALGFLGCASPDNQATPKPEHEHSQKPAPEHSQQAPPGEQPNAPPHVSHSDSPKFSSDREATSYVRRTYQGERTNTSRSSWITNAEYFDAKGRGYLILGMGSRDYIFEGVPPAVWEEFKRAPSPGSYYNSHIRGRYSLELH